MKHRLIALATEKPRWVYAFALALTLALGAQLPRIHVDTDPENMLASDQPDRRFHNEIEARFSLHDAIVVGLVNTSDPNGIYNPVSLASLAALSDHVLRLDGVIEADLMSLAVADNITQAGPGTIRFEWMMRDAPRTRAQAAAIRAAVERLPLLQNTLVSADGRAAAVYVPLERKDLSYSVARDIEALVADLPPQDAFYVTGLPVAEDTFGHEMFVQMGISAPLAGLMIFLLMWYFFRSAALVVAPMLVAMVTVIATMGLLIGLGFTVHIMSSMIPIFLMPIAVVDSVHIMSEFADAYEEGSDAKRVMREVMDALFQPMLFTSLTSAVGFLSLLTTPIPPVQVFGGFVAFGILLAFIVTITLVPAYVVRMKPTRLARLHALAITGEGGTAMARALRAVGRFAFSRRGPVIGAALVLLVLSGVGIGRIVINDNPVRWFKESHRIRVADAVLNAHFAGTYDAFLVLSRPLPRVELEAFDRRARAALATLADRDLAASLETALDAEADGGAIDRFVSLLDDAAFDAEGADLAVLGTLLGEAEALAEAQRFFTRPQALAFVEEVQHALIESGHVGKTSALPDVVKVVSRELRGGFESEYRIPDSARAVAQTLLQYQSSHRPQDLWHMVTPDYTSVAIWVQLRSGDNQDMTRVMAAVDDYLRRSPAPEGVEVRWAGKTYINVVWQEAMVEGMLWSLLSAFFVVFVMMIALFRSVAYGALAMLPLSLTIAAVYGLIGWIGKSYDMPIAVLSSLTLGLSVDFAIHFITRFRALVRADGFAAARRELFEEPARAISRNAVVVALGFTPLFLAPLVPYITVGAFMASIMAISAAVTLLLLPAVLTFFASRFPVAAVAHSDAPEVSGGSQ